MAANLAHAIPKIDGALADQFAAQQTTIQDLKVQVQLLTVETCSQKELILLLRSANEELRQRVMELHQVNEDIRQVAIGYLNIASQLRTKPVLSSEEREIVQSAERAAMVLKCSAAAVSAKDKDMLKREYASAEEAAMMENQIKQDITIVSLGRTNSLTQKSISLNRQEKYNHTNMRSLIRFPLFASFPIDIMEKVSLMSYEMHRKEGQIIVKKGEEGAEIFFLKEGSVSVVVDEEEITVLSPPVFFGEMGRTATVVAKTDAVMVVVTKKKLDEVISEHPEVQQIVAQFSNEKESWWKNQQYVILHEKFGAEFEIDIIREDIQKMNIFSSAPDSFVDALAMAVKCLIFKAGENIVAVDEESDAMYFILSGTVEVVGSNGAIHAEITAGSFFGEVGVLLNMKRTASVRSKEESHVFQLAKKDLDKVIHDYPSVKETLKAAAEERYKLFKQRSESTTQPHVPDQFDMEVGSQSLSKLSIFHGIDPSVVSELAMKMIRKTWSPKESIIRCHESGDSMFFLAAGTAEVVTEFGDVIDAVSGPSAFFGEVALLENVPRTATVKCLSTCSTYELRKEDFQSVMEKHLDIAQKIKATADERMQSSDASDPVLELSQLSLAVDKMAVSDLHTRVAEQDQIIAQMTSRIELLLAERDSQNKERDAQNAVISSLKQSNQLLLESSQAMILFRAQLQDATFAYNKLTDMLLETIKSSDADNDVNIAALLNLSTRTDALYHNPVRIISELRNSNPELAPSKQGNDLHPNLELLKGFPLFSSFPRDVMEQVSLASYELRRREGQIIITKGEEGAEMFFIVSGTVAVVVDGKELSLLTTPVFFGELGVLFTFKRTATIIAKSDCVLAVVTKQKLDKIIEMADPAVQMIMEEFSTNKETWWKQQQYVQAQEKFGAEFVNDIAKKDIRELEIFSDSPDSFIDALAMTITCLVFKAEEYIIELNDDADAMYFVLSGIVEVVGSSGVVHAEIGAGSFFGEVGILLNMKRTASIRAKIESRLFKLAKSSLDMVVKDYPPVREKLEIAAQERFKLFEQRTLAAQKDTNVPDQFDVEVSEQALSKLSFFEGIESHVVSELALLMIRQMWEPSQMIITCGESGNSMFFLTVGSAQVITEFGEVVDMFEAPDAYFGEVAIIEQVPRTASVKCVTTCSTYELKKEDVKSAMRRYPIIAQRIKETANMRLQNVSNVELPFLLLKADANRAVFMYFAQYLMRNILA
ncbi:hypothetical protein HDU78_007169 [Chytriomyces hyalinus]|nr:hypothetical protein HDU78_007169 [Chytriomyces hyalinus]